jgi:serine/threonine protein kinase
MSPEQAMMTSLDIDIRTDIYALGVLLFALLTGRTPYEMRRTIREREPAPPSTLLNTITADQIRTIAHHRRCDPKHLDRAVEGELDWGVMKRLAKDRNEPVCSKLPLLHEPEHARAQRLHHGQARRADAPSAANRL